MRLRALTVLVSVPVLLVASACGGSEAVGDGETSSMTSSADDSGTGGDTATDTGTDTGADEAESTAVADPVDPASLPTATGGFGDKPVLTFPDGPAPDSLQRLVLAEGTGPVAAAGDLIAVDYLGQIWGGDVFDNSYDRGQPFTARIGGPSRQVVTGWDVGLQGVAEGSRVLLSFPARDGYGEQGSPPTIPGGASLVFVVDVLGVYAAGSGGDPAAEPQTVPDGWPEADGALGEVPTVTVPAGLAEPTEAVGTLIARGSGDPVQPGRVVMQYVVTDWDNGLGESTWPPAGADPATVDSGPMALPIGEAGVFAPLIGLPLGSRVLIVAPPTDDGSLPSTAWVVDVIAQAATIDA